MNRRDSRPYIGVQALTPAAVNNIHGSDNLTGQVLLKSQDITNSNSGGFVLVIKQDEGDAVCRTKEQRHIRPVRHQCLCPRQRIVPTACAGSGFTGADRDDMRLIILTSRC